MYIEEGVLTIWRKQLDGVLNVLINSNVIILSEKVTNDLLGFPIM